MEGPGVSGTQTALIDAITAPPNTAPAAAIPASENTPIAANPVVPSDTVAPTNNDLPSTLQANIDLVARSVEQLDTAHRLSISSIRDETVSLAEDVQRTRQAQVDLGERVSGIESSLALLHEEVRQVRDALSAQRSAAKVRQQQPSPERPQWVRTWGGEKMAGFQVGAFSVGDQIGEWKISDIDVDQQRVTVVSLRDPHRELSLTPTSTDQ
ncbi:MAG: hypothetical protein H6981_01205 [Gammaproteobacteria bacterium]|nr:hypothetical protein [Gammaproteobacteria bacterium]MCP5135403.1 hypothetical protein [Gammaproteobacteria bacterium]